MPFSDPQKKKEYNREYHKNRRLNDPQWREKQNQKSQRHYQKIRDFITSLKSPCIVCNESEPCVIDFHHTDPTQKDFNVATMRLHTSDTSVIKEEIDKCVCLCANCHRKVHAGLIDLQV